jgi:TDG/mug DNA glycosylase family protein
MPSSSARCAQFPRAQDKVHFYIKLRELRDELKGIQKSKEIEEVKYSFDLGLAKGKKKKELSPVLLHVSSRPFYFFSGAAE